MALGKKNITLVIVGNGFDLNLGLKSSFKSFYKSPEFQELLYKNKLKKYLVDIDRWSDLESKMYVTTAEDSGFQYPFVPSMVERVKSSFAKYLSKEVKNCKFVESSNISRTLGKLNKGDGVLNFNYTNTLEKAYQYRRNVNYLHGKLNEFDNRNNSLVLGNASANLATGIVEKVFSKSIQREFLYFKRFCYSKNKNAFDQFCQEEDATLSSYKNNPRVHGSYLHNSFELFLIVLNGIYALNYMEMGGDKEKIYDDYFYTSKSDATAEHDINNYCLFLGNKAVRLNRKLISKAKTIKRRYIYDDDFKKWKRKNYVDIFRLKRLISKKAHGFKKLDRDLYNLVIDYFSANGFTPLRIKLKTQNGKYLNPDVIGKIEIMGHSLSAFDIQKEKEAHKKKLAQGGVLRIGAERYLDRTFVDDEEILEELFKSDKLHKIDYFLYERPGNLKEQDQHMIRKQLMNLFSLNNVDIRFVDY